MDKVEQLRQKIEAEKQQRDEFVKQANNEISARNGRITAMEETLVMLTEDEGVENDG